MYEKLDQDESFKIIKHVRPYYATSSDADDRNTHYYDRAFTNILANKFPLPNWAAAFLQSIWLMYRREYKLAFGLSLLSQVVTTLENLYPTTLIGSSLFLSIFLFFVMAFQANNHYFRSILKKANTNTQPAFISPSTDLPAALATVAFIATITIVTFVIMIAQFEAEQVLTGSGYRVISVPKYLGLNWLAFISFWLCIYLWRIMPYKEEAE